MKHMGTWHPVVDLWPEKKEKKLIYFSWNQFTKRDSHYKGDVISTAPSNFNLVWKSCNILQKYRVPNQKPIFFSHSPNNLVIRVYGIKVAEKSLIFVRSKKLYDIKKSFPLAMIHNSTEAIKMKKILKNNAKNITYLKHRQKLITGG